MIQLEELKSKLLELKPQIDDYRSAIGMDDLLKKQQQLEGETADLNFWDDLENSSKVLQQISQIKAKAATYTKMESDYEDLITLIEIAMEEQDDSSYEEIQSLYQALAAYYEEQKLLTLLSGEYDGKNALLTFHAGAGGTEAQDWAEMLFRMYNRWGERHGYKVSTLDYLDGDVAGD